MITALIRARRLHGMSRASRIRRPLELKGLNAEKRFSRPFEIAIGQSAKIPANAIFRDDPAAATREACPRAVKGFGKRAQGRRGGRERERGAGGKDVRNGNMLFARTTLKNELT